MRKLELYKQPAVEVLEQPEAPRALELVALLERPQRFSEPAVIVDEYGQPAPEGAHSELVAVCACGFVGGRPFFCSGARFLVSKTLVDAVEAGSVDSVELYRAIERQGGPPAD